MLNCSASGACIMIEIRKYVSRFQPDPAHPIPSEDRFVVYKQGLPTLMIEFFDTDFHIYGPQPLEPEQFLRAMFSSEREAYFVYNEAAEVLPAIHGAFDDASLTS